MLVAESVELIKDKESLDPSRLPDKVLTDDHRICHAWASMIQKGKKIKGWSYEDVWNAHRLIAQEMLRRGMKHNTPITRSIKSNSELTESKYDQPFPAWKRDGAEGIKGEMIFLPSILRAFSGDFMVSENFVTIVGGLCNYGQTKGDIDILLKCKEPKDDSSPLGMATKFRIARALAKIGVDEARLQFLYDDFHGPFTNHVHLYDLVLRLKPQRELHEMAELAAKSVTPFSFVTQPKPLHGRFKEEIYTPESVAKVVASLKKWQDELPNGIFVEKKHDGVRVQVHKVGSKVQIWTEEKTNVTDKLPSLVEAVKKINHNFVAECEIELWIAGKHENRADTAAVLHRTGTSPDEKNIIATFYDLLWKDGKCIHALDFKQRHVLLNATIGKSASVKVSQAKIVKSLDALKSEVIKASKLPGSEGAMIKMASYKYPLTAHTSQMIKFKNEFSINVEVVEVHHVKDSKARNYLTAIRDKGKLYPTGRTYNTNIVSEEGGKLKVVFVELSKYVDPKSKDIWFNFWSPRVIAKASKSDSLATAEALVKKSGGQIATKPFPSRYKGLLNDADYISEFLQSALLWDTEEFDFALHNGWITPELIPAKLSNNRVEIRNQNDYLLKKCFENRALICLRDDKNLITSENYVELVEA